MYTHIKRDTWSDLGRSGEDEDYTYIALVSRLQGVFHFLAPCKVPFPSTFLIFFSLFVTGPHCDPKLSRKTGSLSFRLHVCTASELES